MTEPAVTPPGPPDAPAPRWRRWAVFAVVATGLVLALTHGPDEATVIRRSGEWRAAARANLPASVAAFVTAEFLLVAFSAPVGIWLAVLAGFLFGTGLGTAAVNVGSTAGAVAAFLASRYLFAGALRRAAATRPRLAARLAAVDRGFGRRGGYYVLLLRLTPVVPFWVLNLGLGLTPVRLRTYWWATQLGTLPATLVVCFAGAGLAEITTFRDVLSPRVLGGLCLLPLVPFVLHRVGRLTLAR